jgi:hypothetical protein
MATISGAVVKPDLRRGWESDALWLKPLTIPCITHSPCLLGRSKPRPMYIKLRMARSKITYNISQHGSYVYSYWVSLREMRIIKICRRINKSNPHALLFFITIFSSPSLPPPDFPFCNLTTPSKLPQHHPPTRRFLLIPCHIVSFLVHSLY